MGVRTGAQYVQGLHDNREVWIGGKRVRDVTTHPAFRQTISTVAKLYDAQHDARWSSVLVGRPAGSTDSVGKAFVSPATLEDLVERRQAIELWATPTAGMFGRSPDFFGCVVAAFGSASDYFGESDPAFGRNVTRFCQYATTHDMFLTRATIAPQGDRSLPSAQQQDEFLNLRVVRETAAGLIVRGAKMISTNAPIADELLVFPLPGLKLGDEPYALSFCLPIGTTGLKFICREPFGNERTTFDHPLSSQFEEIDALCVFDDVLIPWERLFFYGDVERANVLYGETMARNHAGHQAMVRSLVKAKFLVGIAIALAESANTKAFMHVQQLLGELVSELEIVKGLIVLSERNGQTSRWGTYCPALAPIQAFRCHFPKANAKFVEAIQALGGGSLLAAPTSFDLESEVGADVRRYLRGASDQGDARIRLLKLAWDATGDGFGQRQLLYEKYHAGDPVRLAVSQFNSYEKSDLLGRVASLLASTAQPSDTTDISSSVEARELLVGALE